MPERPIQNTLTMRIKTPTGWDEPVIRVYVEGRPFYWTIKPTFRDPGDPRNAGDGNGLPGKYRVVLTLCRPGHSLTNAREWGTEVGLAGDSNLVVTEDLTLKHRLLINDAEVTYQIRLIANAKGRLGKLAIDELNAQNFADASSRAGRLIGVLLNLWATHADVPLRVQQVDMTEIRTGAVSGEVFIEPPDVGFYMEGVCGMGTDFSHYASLYREALNSTSPAYQFLCFFKIIDSLGMRRKRLKSKRDRGQISREQFPGDWASFLAWLDPLYPPNARRDWAGCPSSNFPNEILGRKFGHVVDSMLRPIRNKIAHAILHNGELGFTTSDQEHVREIYRWVPIARFLVRRMLRNEFSSEFLFGVLEDGALDPDIVEARANSLWTKVFSGKVPVSD